MQTVTTKEAWQMLNENRKDNKHYVYLIDVRTNEELHFTGKPNLATISQHLITIEWRKLPDMYINLEFIEELQSQIMNKEKSKLLFLCRTGIRSTESALAALNVGYKNCFNVLHGFEGELNNEMHRGMVSGWKADKLPWSQT